LGVCDSRSSLAWDSPGNWFTSWVNTVPGHLVPPSFFCAVRPRVHCDSVGPLRIGPLLVHCQIRLFSNCWKFRAPTLAGIPPCPPGPALAFARRPARVPGARRAFVYPPPLEGFRVLGWVGWQCTYRANGRMQSTTLFTSCSCLDRTVEPRGLPPTHPPPGAHILSGRSR